MDVKEKIEYWIDLSKDDFIPAEIVLKSKRFLHFGFLCHLTVEKLLKAFYWKNKSSEPPYTNSLLTLSFNSGLNDAIKHRSEVSYKQTRN